MEDLTPYVGHLESLIASILRGDNPTAAELTEALNGGPSQKVRVAVDRDTRRKDGIYFTSHELAGVVGSLFRTPITGTSLVIDPACGAGDLLLAASDSLPLLENVSRTLHLWGRVLSGRDLHGQLTRMSRLRLMLKAMVRHGDAETKIDRRGGALSGVRRGNGLGSKGALSKASHVVLNPPFGRIQAPHHIAWSSGKVEAAAVFFDHCLSQMSEGAEIVAILPDALRSGSRYRKWRESVANRASVEEVKIWEQFDPDADVHVFLVCARKGNGDTSRAWPIEGPAPSTVGQRFAAAVGPVVEYRDANRGPLLPYLLPKDLPRGGEITSVRQSRAWSGSTFQAPFVVVRRTSRPGDRPRAVATLVSGKKSFAVENHLILLRPNDGLVSTCRALMRVLESSRTAEWLDQRIRCRHLTLGALTEIPWETIDVD